MSNVLGLPHEFRSNVPRRRVSQAKAAKNDVTLVTGNSGTVPPFVFTENPAPDNEWFEKVWALLSALWNKAQENDEKLDLAVQRISAGEPSATKLPQKYLTTQQFANRSGLDIKTVEKYCREGKLLSIKALGRGKSGEHRISWEEYERWQKEGLRRPKILYPK